MPLRWNLATQLRHSTQGLIAVAVTQESRSHPQETTTVDGYELFVQRQGAITCMVTGQRCSQMNFLRDVACINFYYQSQLIQMLVVTIFGGFPGNHQSAKLTLLSISGYIRYMWQ